MNTLTLPPELPDNSAFRAERLRDLAALRGIAMRMARDLERAVLEPAEPGAPPPAILGRGDPALTLSRIASVIRQTVALETKIEDGPLKPRGKPQISDVARAAEKHRNKRMKKIFEDSLTAAGISGQRAEQMRMEAYAYMADPALLARYEDQPLCAIICEICHQVGIKGDLQYCTDDEIGMGRPGWDHTIDAPDGTRWSPPEQPTPASPGPAATAPRPDPNQDSPAWRAAIAKWEASEAAKVDPRPG